VYFLVRARRWWMVSELKGNSTVRMVEGDAVFIQRVDDQLLLFALAKVDREHGN
jgi:hypothetical protein